MSLPSSSPNEDRQERILIIDDEISIVDFLGEILEEQGYIVSRAYNGLDGLIRARAEVPTLILCDIMMPLLDGFAFLSLARSDPRLRHTRIILMSAVDRLPAEGVRPEGFLRKPFSIPTVEQTVARIIRSPVSSHTEEPRADNPMGTVLGEQREQRSPA